MENHTNTNDQNLNSLQVDVGIIKSQQVEANKKMDRIEKKLDNMTYVPKSDFDDFRNFVKETYATNETVKPLVKLFWSVVGTILVLAAVAVIKLIPKG